MTLTTRLSAIIRHYMAAIMLCLYALLAQAQGTTPEQKIWFDQMDLSQIQQGWSNATANKNLRNKPITLGGVVYEHGVCTHAFSEAIVLLNGQGLKFHAVVGIEDINKDLPGKKDVLAYIVADRKKIWTSPRLTAGGPPSTVDLDLKGIKHLELYIEGIDGQQHTHTSWADAYFTYRGTAAPKLIRYQVANAAENHKYIRTPKAGPKPRLTGATVFGVRPGRPILHRITATGTKPIKFSAIGLPDGVVLDSLTGMLTGQVTTVGTYTATVYAQNAVGKAERKFTLKVGNTIGLTPAMGWNSWNCWGMAVDAEKVKAAADALVSSGLADHGWTYVNLDDGWQGPDRDSATGIIQTDPVKFPDMKALADYVHAKGLKIGIYSSPGKLTCGKRLGSMLHEELDASTWARWGMDYIKYDKCSYTESIPIKEYRKYWEQLPYRIMQQALEKQPRDMVYSMCQYGDADVQTWAASLNANSWRNTDDIIDTWESMRSIGLKQLPLQRFNKPGHFNDPDMLVLGKVGWGPNLHDTRLTAGEQYVHMSLWCLFSAPLLLGNDLKALDPFTLNLLTNAEVLDVNQDEAAHPAEAVYYEGDVLIIKKPLANGSMALGIFNLGRETQTINLPAEVLKLGNTKQGRLRDLWRHKNIGSLGPRLSLKLEPHDCEMWRIDH